MADREDVEFRLEVSIKRRLPGEDDFTEIGFCAADSRTVDGAEYEIGTAIQRREWETEGDMPDPMEVDHG